MQTLDFTNTTIPSSTSFNSVVQQLMDKIFPKIKIVATWVNVTGVAGATGLFRPTTFDVEFISVNTNNSMTCKIAGIYKITYTGGTAGYLWLKKNGTEFSPSHPTIGESVTVDLAIGDVLSVINPSGTSSATINGTIEYLS